MQWGDITLKEDDTGRYLELRERCTKTRTGETKDAREFAPRAYENVENPDRCPVELYLKYASHRPVSTLIDEAPFFLAVNNMNKDIEKKRSWFKTSKIGRNSIAYFMKTMAQSAGLNGKLTNHSVRKTTCTKLLQAGITPTLIQQVSGHKDVRSISNYATASSHQIREMNRILSNTDSSIGAPAVTASDPSPAISENVENIAENTGTSVSNTQLVRSSETRPAATVSYATMMMNARSTTSGLFENANFQHCTFNFTFSKPSDD